MDAKRNSFELFSLPGGVAGAPEQLSPASFAAMGALELQDIERWIRERPLLLGEELKIVTHQFASFERTKDRLDILAIDREGRLVVIEVKRDTSRLLPGLAGSSLRGARLNLPRRNSR
jgi:hypothetical protein